MIDNEIEREIGQQEPDRQEVNATDAVQRRLIESRGADQAKAPENEASPHLKRSAELIADWEQLEGDPAARRYLLDRVGREMLAEYGAVPGELNLQAMPENERGSYTRETNETDLNARLAELSDPKEALHTYLHEYRHAIQGTEVSAYRLGFYREVDVVRAAQLDRPYEKPPEAGTPPEEAERQYSKYEQQFSETDARSFADDLTDKILKLRDEYRSARDQNLEPRSDADRAVEARLTSSIALKV
jgi:hypothetical protein